MWVHPHDAEVPQWPEESMLTSGWVADREAAAGANAFGEKEQAVTGCLRIEGIVKLGDGMELVVLGGGPAVQGEDVVVVDAEDPRVVAGENRKAGLVGVVGEEEVAGAGDAAPGAADGAAAEERFWGQADEDLPEDDLVWEVAAAASRSCPCGVSHGRRSGKESSRDAGGEEEAEDELGWA
jgi:hypothetical protein